MKYYQELTAIENVSIDLESLLAVMIAVTEATPSMSTEKVQMAMYNIENQLTELDLVFKNRFIELWDVIKEDSIKEEKVENKKPKKSKK
jgi:hypothetical protein|tara:strand:+ start:340 stop:606 length:267 start_codon:yes stop_codon:yes gene_type:complete